MKHNRTREVLGVLERKDGVKVEIRQPTVWRTLQEQQQLVAEQQVILQRQTEALEQLGGRVAELEAKLESEAIRAAAREAELKHETRVAKWRWGQHQKDRATALGYLINIGECWWVKLGRVLRLVPPLIEWPAAALEAVPDDL